MTGGASAEAPKRRYDNSLRRERANETRERIVTAGIDLVRESSIGDWRGVTMRAVADRADVNERTVYRHFPNERALRDAVMQQLEQSVGIELANLTLDRIPDATARMVRHLSSYPPHARPPLDPTLVEANRRQHDALLAAVKEHADRWTAADRTLAAAMLDVLWASPTYERLARDWNLDAEESIRGITWVIGLLEGAIHKDERPPHAKRARNTKESS
ncbi:MAG TPA: TetR/AcrR family transcriptional regulator [Acidimicrobiia bacterium]